MNSCLLSLQAGKVRKMPHEQNKDENSLGGNLRIIVLIATLFIVLLFVVHCTWVTSNAYSSPSVVLATYDQHGRLVKCCKNGNLCEV